MEVKGHRDRDNFYLAALCARSVSLANSMVLFVVINVVASKSSLRQNHQLDSCQPLPMLLDRF